MKKLSLTIEGVGYRGEGKHIAYIKGIMIKKHKVWASMLRRCYNEKYHRVKPTYIDCSVHPDWHNYQVFAEWFEKNYVEGWALDKDILVKGNKIYRPDTCCFIPNEINILFTNRSKHRGEYPVGVKKHNNRFKAAISINGKITHLGTYDTPEEAFKAYKIAKESHIKVVADKWKDRITPQVYQALINYKIEITD